MMSLLKPMPLMDYIIPGGGLVNLAVLFFVIALLAYVCGAKGLAGFTAGIGRTLPVRLSGPRRSGFSGGVFQSLTAESRHFPWRFPCWSAYLLPMLPLLPGMTVLDRMVLAVERVRDRLARASGALESAGIPYAVAGGNAVATWVATIDAAAVRNTQDVDILLADPIWKRPPRCWRRRDSSAGMSRVWTCSWTAPRQSPRCGAYRDGRRKSPPDTTGGA